MIGRACSTGAISLVNALFDGVGGAAGIDLGLSVELETDPAGLPAGAVEILPTSSDTPVARDFLRALREAAPDPPALRVEIRSEIPAAVGLKSSSALGTALVRALARAQGRSLSAEAAARHAAKIARRTGQSATGAFDDALASVLPGTWITDNPTLAILRHDPIPEDLRVVLWIPPGHHRPSPEWHSAFRAASGNPGRAAALAGRPWDALMANGQAVETLLGLDLTGSAALRSAGALGAGVTGLGPARAAVVPSDRVAAVRGALDGRPGIVRTVRFRGRDPDGEAA